MHGLCGYLNVESVVYFNPKGRKRKEATRFKNLAILRGREVERLIASRNCFERGVEAWQD